MPAKVAVIGEEEFILPFKTSGLSVFTAQRGEYQKLVRRLTREGYGVVFFEEELMGELSDILEEVKRSPLPCLIPIPRFQEKGKKRLAMTRLKEIIRKAVGVDIFLEEE